MTKTITFNELRKIKDSLPHGSMAKIAEEVGLDTDTVRNYFGGSHFQSGQSAGLHIEPGPDGGVVMLDDTHILDLAMKMIQEAGETRK